MADLALPAAREKHEIKLLDNVIKGRRERGHDGILWELRGDD